MDGRLVQTSCRTAQFAAVEATLREWPEVEAVGSFRVKNNNKKDLTTVLVTFQDEAAAKAAKAKLAAIPAIAEAAAAATTASSATPSASSPEQAEKAVAGGSQGKRAQKKKGNASLDKSLAAEFLSFESYEDQRRRDGQQQGKKKPDGAEGAATGRGAGRGGRGGAGRGAARGGRGVRGGAASPHNGNADGGRGRGSQRGGRGRGGAQQQQQQFHAQPPLAPGQQPPPPHMPPYQQFQPQPYQQRPRLPPFEANVAFVDNVPFGTTNSFLMERFSAFGRILDINRYELMVMICFDNPESVQQCIQHMNGSRIHENVITVSSGTVRIPGSVAIQMGV